MNNQLGRTAALIGSLAAAAAFAVLCPAAIAQTSPVQSKTHAAAHAKGHPASHTAAKITAAQADAIVLKRFPGKIQGKTKLENEDGKMQFSVMDRSGKVLREVMVDAQTGKIATVEVTTNKQEAAENKAEMSKTHAVAHKGAGEPASTGHKAVK